MDFLTPYFASWPYFTGIPVVTRVQPKISLAMCKAWYLDFLSAELEALPPGPHKDAANAAARQMIARITLLEETLTAAKAARDDSLKVTNVEGEKIEVTNF